jgi:four helix bundle protein
MPAIDPRDLRQRTFRFACDVFDFCEDLACLPGVARRIASQLFDAGASVGANQEEAKAAYSRREFAATNAISLKECREAKYWLRLADARSLGNPQRRKRLLQEVDELVAILTTSVKRLQTQSPREL